MIPIGHTYEIHVAPVHPTVRDLHLSDFDDEDTLPAERCGRPAGNWTPAQLGYRKSKIHDAGALYENEIEAADAEQTRRCMRLWQAVLLQAILDMSYERYKKSEASGTRYEAIHWIEGRTPEDEEARDFVFHLAGFNKKRVDNGYRRLKEANWELRDAVGNDNFAPLIRQYHAGDDYSVSDDNNEW